MRTVCILVLTAVLALQATTAITQVELDRKVQFTGTGSDAKIEGVEEVVNDHDVANKKYVDDRTFGHFIGELYGGGIVFYTFRENGEEHGLIVSLHNLDWWSAWSNVTSGSANAANNIDGLANSLGIVAQPGHTSSPALHCLNYSHGGFDDWYLPATYELQLINRELYMIEKVILTDPSYHYFGINNFWSSTEAWWNPSQAFRLNIGTSSMEVIPKTGSSQNNIVRCVRRY